MQLRKLYRTIENIGSQPFENTEELLRRVLEAVVQNEEIKLKGGRIWKFNPKGCSYMLLQQVGDMQPIEPNYQVKVKDYPVFGELAKVRTVLAKEENEYFRNRGIVQYSATGIGDKVQSRGYTLYPWVLAFNDDQLDERSRATVR